MRQAVVYHFASWNSITLRGDGNLPIVTDFPSNIATARGQVLNPSPAVPKYDR